MQSAAFERIDEILGFKPADFLPIRDIDLHTRRDDEVHQATEGVQSAGLIRPPLRFTPFFFRSSHSRYAVSLRYRLSR